MLEDRPLPTAPPSPPHPAGDSDREILGFLEAGQRRQALKLLVQRYGKDVFHRCASLVRDAALAEDLMQRVYIEAFRDLRTFRAQSDLRGWLLGIASHRCLDELKRRRREEGRQELDPQPLAQVADPAAPASEALDRRRLYRALEECLEGRLSRETQAVVLLRFREGLSYPELGSRTGLEPATLQVRVARALPRLRECLEQKGFTP